MRRTSVKRSLLIWCSVGLGTGFPKSAPCGTSLWRLSPAIHGLRNFWKACPQPHRYDLVLSASQLFASISCQICFLSVLVRECLWLKEQLTLSHVVHPRFNPHRPQLLVVSPSLVQYGRVVVGDQGQSAVLVGVAG